MSRRWCGRPAAVCGATGRRSFGLDRTGWGAAAWMVKRPARPLAECRMPLGGELGRAGDGVGGGRASGQAAATAWRRGAVVGSHRSRWLHGCVGAAGSAVMTRDPRLAGNGEPGGACAAAVVFVATARCRSAWKAVSRRNRWVGKRNRPASRSPRPSTSSYSGAGADPDRPGPMGVPPACALDHWARPPDQMSPPAGQADAGEGNF